MDIYAKRGTKVVFTDPDAGYDSDRERAAEHLKVGETYTVEMTDVGGWHTAVYLEEVPGVPFNSVHFT